MKKFDNREAAFASQNFDPAAVELSGVPEQHVEAVKAFINLCVAHDAVNPDFKPDYSKSSQLKWEAYHRIGSPSGAGFSFLVDGSGGTYSSVGARLVSESPEAVRHIADIFDQDYKKLKVYDRKIG